MVSVSGEWDTMVAKLYSIFDHDFRQTGCSFQRAPVWWDQRKLDGSPYEEGFWHLITKLDYAQKERLFDPPRAKRLPWCKPTIVNSGAPEVKVWNYVEAKGRIRTYLWLENWDYVIILEKRRLSGGRRAAFLTTAFCVGGKSTRRNLQKKYAKRIR